MQPKLLPDRLLAKSKSVDKSKWRHSYGLAGHTLDVVDAVTSIVDFLGESIIIQFGLAI